MNEVRSEEDWLVAISLLSPDDGPVGSELRLAAGSWSVGSDAGCDLWLPGCAAACLAVLHVSEDAISIEARTEGVAVAGLPVAQQARVEVTQAVRVDGAGVSLGARPRRNLAPTRSRRRVPGRAHSAGQRRASAFRAGHDRSGVRSVGGAAHPGGRSRDGRLRQRRRPPARRYGRAGAGAVGHRHRVARSFATPRAARFSYRAEARGDAVVVTGEGSDRDASVARELASTVSSSSGVRVDLRSMERKLIDLDVAFAIEDVVVVTRNGGRIRTGDTIAGGWRLQAIRPTGWFFSATAGKSVSDLRRSADGESDKRRKGEDS